MRIQRGLRRAEPNGYNQASVSQLNTQTNRDVAKIIELTPPYGLGLAQECGGLVVA
jgi:hypothetical protein